MEIHCEVWGMTENEIRANALRATRSFAESDDNLSIRSITAMPDVYDARGLPLSWRADVIAETEEPA